MVNRLFNVQWSMFNLFTCLRFCFVFGSAQEKIPRASGKIFCLRRPQIPLFLFDNAKVRIFHCSTMESQSPKYKF